MVLGLIGLATTLRADTTTLSGATEITHFPYAIGQPGVYYLGQNFNLNLAGGNAITVFCDGVTIDLNGHTLSNLAAGSGSSEIGISCNGHSRLTVRHGTLRGFLYGVSITSPDDYNPSDGNLIENVRLLNCTVMGVRVEASGTIVRHCQAYKIGGSTSFLVLPCGIQVTYGNNAVLDCDVSEVGAGSAADAFGIAVYGSSTLIMNNRVGGAKYGVYFAAEASGKYRDNLCAASVTTPYTGGTNVGNN